MSLLVLYSQPSYVTALGVIIIQIIFKSSVIIIKAVVGHCYRIIASYGIYIHAIKALLGFRLIRAS